MQKLTTISAPGAHINLNDILRLDMLQSTRTTLAASSRPNTGLKWIIGVVLEPLESVILGKKKIC